MPSLEHHVAEPKLNDVFSKDDGVQDLKLSVTESTSFGSPIPEYDEQDLQLTLSSDSMGFNFQESFDIGTGPSFDGTVEERSLSPAMDTTSSEKDMTTTNERTQGDADSHHKVSYPKGSYPPTYSTQPCPQPHSYYGSHYPQSHGSYAFYPQSYAPPHYGYNPSAMSSDQSIRQHHSSESSVSSNLSKKRSIDEVNDTNGDFTIHRGGSNNSVSSYSTTNTAPTQISRLSHGSPMKREDFCPSTLYLERSNSTESNDSSLAFSTLTVNSKNESKERKNMIKKETDEQGNLVPSPINENMPDTGITPICKNTKNTNDHFFFSDEKNSTTPLPSIAMCGSCSSEEKIGSSPEFNLDGNWNQGNSPVSLGGEINGIFLDDHGSSPLQMTSSDIQSPRLSDGFMGSNSPMTEFFNISPKEKDGPDNMKASKSTIPTTPLPVQSSYMSSTFTPHQHPSMMGSHMLPQFHSPRHLYPGSERIVNLRGHLPRPDLPKSMPLPPQIPSHHHFLTSPIGAPRNMLPMQNYGMASPYRPQQSQSPHAMNLSKRKCIPLKQIPTKFQGNIDQYKNTVIPDFVNLVNFPSHMSQKQAVTLPDGMRCCVMCGNACRVASSKNKKGSKNDQHQQGANGQFAMIPTQNKGLCTLCDVNVWVITNSNMEIKWCKGCKNFRPWAAFGDKGTATKCVRCRDRQREKYAATKEKKEKIKASMKKGK